MQLKCIVVQGNKDCKCTFNTGGLIVYMDGCTVIIYQMYQTVSKAEYYSHMPG